MDKVASGTWTEADPWMPSAYDRPDIVPADIPVADIGNDARTEAQLRAALRDAIGGDEAFFGSPAGDEVMVNQAIVDHMLEKPSERWDGREAYFPFIPELIENPYEIWISFARDAATGIYGIREKYIKVIELDKKITLGFVAETNNGIWSGFNFYRGGSTGLNNLRKGRLLYGR